MASSTLPSLAQLPCSFDARKPARRAAARKPSTTEMMQFFNDGKLEAKELHKIVATLQENNEHLRKQLEECKATYDDDGYNDYGYDDYDPPPSPPSKPSEPSSPSEPSEPAQPQSTSMRKILATAATVTALAGLLLNALENANGDSSGITFQFPLIMNPELGRSAANSSVSTTTIAGRKPNAAPPPGGSA